MTPTHLLATMALSLALIASPATTPIAHATPAAMPTAASAPRLTSIWNFRDVAGDGVVLADGTTMATGRVYRSGQLKGLSTADGAVLTGLGITRIYDLRSASAIASAPDPAVVGAKHQKIDVFAGKHKGFRGSSTAAARAYMRAMNRAFVTVPAQRTRIAKVLTAISKATEPVLIHCAVGKDRTGWVSAMLLKIAGASRKTIVDQYLLSNTYRADLIKARVAAVRAAHGAKRAAITSELETLRASYLESGLDKAARKYGSLRGYLTKGLKLSSATIARLRDHLRQQR
ncbi:MAG: tyrosine-protein phosphatase [Propionicimonas sp.]